MLHAPPGEQLFGHSGIPALQLWSFYYINWSPLKSGVGNVGPERPMSCIRPDKSFGMALSRHLRCINEMFDQI